jgi:hypothetical protein
MTCVLSISEHAQPFAEHVCKYSPSLWGIAPAKSSSGFKALHKRWTQAQFFSAFEQAEKNCDW